MAKLVVLNNGMKGRSYELAMVLTTIGRIEDNSFQIPEPSVSSHHCEVLLRGADIVIKDLNSTNGTFVNGDRVESERVLQPGQIIRLGNLELRLEGDGQSNSPLAAAAAAAPPAAPAAPAKKVQDKSSLGSQGVTLSEVDQGTKTVTFDKNSAFAKKKSGGSKGILIGMIAGVIILLAVIAYFIFNV